MRTPRCGSGRCRCGRPAARPAACRCARPAGSRGRTAGRSRRHRPSCSSVDQPEDRAAGARGARPRSAGRGGLPAPRPASADTRAGTPTGGPRRRSRLPSACGSSSAITSWITAIGSRSVGVGALARSGVARRGPVRRSRRCSRRRRRARSRTAGRAVPVLAAALQGAQRLAALGADTAARPPGAGLAQGDAAGRRPPGAPGNARRRARRALGQGRRQAPRLRPAARDGGDHGRGSARGASAGSTAATRSTINPIGSETARSACSGAVTAARRRGCGPAWAADPRRRPRRRPPSLSCGRCLDRRGDRLDQVVHRAVEDVAAAPSGSSGSAVRDARRPAGRPGWRTA